MIEPLKHEQIQDMGLLVSNIKLLGGIDYAIIS